MKPRPAHYAVAAAIAVALLYIAGHLLLAAYHEYAPREWGRLW